ncbi:hypothetical protein B0O80DRAFT_425964 [Mortierella sp. GBAus27b]|nr:hypothetical protein B0O80DRAFT_425964 [Mortierella sp. GBAus27b]
MNDSRTSSSSPTPGSPNPDKDAEDRWPSLLSIRQVITPFILETITSTRPLREKLSVVALQTWRHYMEYVQAYPILTLFLSSLVLLSAGPIIIFACVTGASLGILVGVAAVVVIVIQSIIVSIAGAILLFILGTIFVLTAFTFFWLVVGYLAFHFVRNLVMVFQAHHQEFHRQQQQQQKQQRQQHQSNGASVRQPEKSDSKDAVVPE